MLVLVEKDRIIVIRTCVALENGQYFNLNTQTSIPKSFCSYFMYRREKVKVKCTLVQALRLCTGHTAHRESRVIQIDQFFTSAQHLFSLITIGLHVSTLIQSSSGPSQWL